MFSEGIADFCSPETQEAYRQIYNVENYLRFVIKWELVAEYGANWRSALGSPGSSAATKLEEEEKIGLIDTEKLNVMSYMMLSDLRTVMIDDQNWPLFAKVWGKKEFFSQQLVLLNRIRNKVMHCRALTTVDGSTLTRTLETVAALSRKYKDQLNASAEQPITASSMPEAIRKHVRKLVRPPVGGGRWIVQSRRDVARYWRIGLALENGAFREDDALKLFVRSGRDCLFAAADPASGRLELYIPMCIEAQAVDDFMTALQAIKPLDGTQPGGPSPDDAEDHFDGLFHLPVDLPVTLRLP